MNAAVDVVICVHDALDDVRACVASVMGSNEFSLARIILVDDGSSLETRAYLAELAGRPRVSVLRSEEATGYTRAANRGLMRSTANRIVLLNSDTIVPAGWLKKLNSVFDRYPDAGMVGPLSNAATWQSVPRVVDDSGAFAVNPIPGEMSVDEYDQLLEIRASGISIRPRVQLLNGFCIMLSRAVIDAIGYLDEKSFPRGYGEENDYCFRASDAGFGLFLAVDTYVFHAKSKSYGPTKRKLLAEEGGKAFQRKYPKHRIEGAVASMRENPFLREIRAALG